MNTLDDRITFLSELIQTVRNDLIHQTFSSISLKEEAFDNIVTDVDVLVQERLVHALSDRFPDTAFLNEEETTHVMSDRLWIIDPIDGTKNFVRRQEDFAISVAYYENRQPVFGIVMDVAKDALYVGVEGRGAWLNGQSLSHLKNRPLREAVLDVNLKTLDYLNRVHHADIFALSKGLFAHRSIGSGALSLCRIAAGKHDVYVGDSISLWDYAAGAIILRGVGGVVELPFLDPRRPEPAPQTVIGAAHPNQIRALFEILHIQH